MGGHTVSHHGYLPDWHFDIHAVFYRLGHKKSSKCFSNAKRELATRRGNEKKENDIFWDEQ